MMGDIYSEIEAIGQLRRAIIAKQGLREVYHSSASPSPAVRIGTGIEWEEIKIDDCLNIRFKDGRFERIQFDSLLPYSIDDLLQMLAFIMNVYEKRHNTDFNFHDRCQFTLRMTKALVFIVKKWDRIPYHLDLELFLHLLSTPSRDITIVDRHISINLVLLMKRMKFKIRSISKTLQFWRRKFDCYVGGYVRCTECTSSVPIDMLEGVSDNLYRLFPHGKDCSFAKGR